MVAKIKNKKKILKNTQHPFTAIMGGAKVSDKILIIGQLLDKADNILIGGGMAFTFFKAMGGSIGSSLVEDAKLDLAKELLDKAKSKNCTLVLPLDSVAADKFDKDANTRATDSMNIETGWMGLD